LGLRSFRPVRSARKLGPGPEPLPELTVADDRITVEMNGHEWAEIECLWNA
jgi:hypothetical protein